jgi:hypothetical protein
LNVFANGAMRLQDVKHSANATVASVRFQPGEEPSRFTTDDQDVACGRSFESGLLRCS